MIAADALDHRTNVALDEMTLEVVARVRESRNVISLHLRPVAGSVWQPFHAGQHLPLRLCLPGRPVATYTISSSPLDRTGYRISVKLEPDGKGGSRYLHEHAGVGTHLKAASPRGNFVLEDDARAVVLLTGGIGVTPAIAMLHALSARPARPVYFIHACNNSDEHSFTDEVGALVASRPWIRVFVAHAEPPLAGARVADHTGFLDRALLRSILPLDDYRVYLCGPDGFMAGMRDALTSLGIDDSRIRQETFAPAASAPARPVVASEPRVATGQPPSIHFARSKKSAVWTPGTASLLDFVEAQGLLPDFSCRAGVCGTCACRLIRGEVIYTDEPLEPPPPGEILLCCAQPGEDLVLDL